MKIQENVDDESNLKYALIEGNIVVLRIDNTIANSP